MAVVFLFGAGASFSSGNCYPQCPPLGGQLFDEMRKNGGLLSTVSEDLAAKFRDPIRGFEAGMEAFFIERNVETTALLKEMALYFVRFEPRAGNLYLELIRALHEKGVRPIYATLNYDLLIECSASALGLFWTHKGPTDHPDAICLLKLHGSCNFLPDLGTNRYINLTFKMTPGNPNQQTVAAPIKVAQPEEVVAYCSDPSTSVAPALALYARGKQIIAAARDVKAQQQEWRRQVQAASRIYIIGVSVNREDPHIWDAIRDSPAPIDYVDPYPEKFLAWTAEQGRPNVRHLAASFRAAVPLIVKQLPM